MTKDEAIEIFDENTNIHDRGETSRWIDRFVRLGMLRLDEDHQFTEGGTIGRIRSFMREMQLGKFSPSQFCGALDRAGLKIVEK